jgi:hypothetical protein
MPTRKNLSFAQQIAIDRRHNEYIMGGCWNPFDRTKGTDCSDCAGKELAAARDGTAMSWARQVSTESWRPPAMGGNADPDNGPYGTVMVDHPDQFPPKAAVLIALHHGDGTAADSHMWCQVDKLKIETHGSSNQFPDGATVLNDGVNFTDQVLDVRDTSYANNWWYLPGPIVEDGTPIPTQASSGGAPAATDTLFADVSEFQPPVDDSYPYKVLSIRVCDGTYQDHNFAANYAWMRRALDKGTLTFGIIYTYVRPLTWQANLATVKQMIDQDGGLHPRVALMLDVESGGNPAGDQSAAINALHDGLADYAGSPARIIGYGNVNDLNTMWPHKPAGVQLIVAAYGNNPDYPGKVAHQYTDGTGFGGGLPEGCPPFGNCDMNSADGLDPDAFAAACGIGTAAPTPTPVPTPTPAPPPTDPFLAWIKGAADRELLEYIVEQLGPGDPSWTSKGQTLRDFLWSLTSPSRQTAAKKRNK